LNKSNMVNIEQLTYILPVLKGIAYPLLKISFIGMSEKLFRNAAQATVSVEEFERIDSVLFGTIRSDPVTRVFLLSDLTFYQCFFIALSLVVLISIVYPLNLAMTQYCLNKREVKRLQKVLYQKFILEPNSFNVSEASDLVHTKLAVIEQYWYNSKYFQVGDMTTVIVSLALFLTLAWDLGLLTVGASTVIFFVSTFIWRTLSRPYAQSQAQKEGKASAQLLDLVLCKEVVLTHGQEKEEQVLLHEAIDADKGELLGLARAHFASHFVETLTFTMIMPSLFVFVKEVDLTTDRVFQLLIVIVVLDETLRSYLEYSKRSTEKEEFKRAKAVMCNILNMEEEELFPPPFQWNKILCFAGWWKANSPVEEDPEGGKAMVSGHMDEIDEEASASTTSIPGGSDEDAFGVHVCTMQAVTPKVHRALTNPKEDNLSMEGVSFGYKSSDGGTYRVFNGLYLNLKLGVHYGVMGETGAGKSTIFKGLSGLIRPLQGEIRVANEKIDAACISWRKQLGVVTQHSILLNRTLRENLIYGNEKACNDEDILEALDQVHMKNRVLALPNGLDTIIQENGHEFSGGQRQRFQIVRLLLRDSPIVLLDEFTSALDAETTDDILKVLVPYLKGKTLIMITHDVQTLVLADQVLKLTADGIVRNVKKRRSIIMDK